MSDSIENNASVPSTPARTNAAIWQDILNLQIQGYAQHLSLYEQCKLNDLQGCAAMHMHHTHEEFHNFLHVLDDYITYFGAIPVINFSLPVTKLDGATVEEKVKSCMEAYEVWEKSVLNKLIAFRNELTEYNEEVDYLIKDVKDEIKCIHLMENDILSGKTEELEKWLIRKWGD